MSRDSNITHEVAIGEKVYSVIPSVNHELRGILVSNNSRIVIRNIERRIPIELGISICNTSIFKKNIRHSVDNCQFVFFDNTNNELPIYQLIKSTRSLSLRTLSIVAFTSNDDIPIIDSLAWGADECITDSMSDEQIEARLFAQNRSRDKFELIRRNGISFSSEGLIIKGVKIDLSSKETDLFGMFIYRIGEIVSREELCWAVWGKEKGSVGRTLDVHISNLREKAFMNPKTNLRLISIYGKGYKLEAYDFI